jgi:hypothetical protein
MRSRMKIQSIFAMAPIQIRTLPTVVGAFASHCKN